MTLDERKQKAEEIAGPITWDGEDRGYFACPLGHLHTSPTRKGHTVVYLDGVPTFFCWHQSCQAWHQSANQVLRQACDDRTSSERKADKEARRAKAIAHDEALAILANRDEIYEKYHWHFPDNPLNSSDSYAAFLTIWDPRDVIWVGEVYNTGNRGGDHFKPAEDWARSKVNLCGNHFTCASTFRPGSLDRTNKEVLTTPYLVIEFDNLAKDKEENRQRGAALLNYIQSRFGLVLRMVVDSGNKSLHGWFVNEGITGQTKFLLRQLGADINTMRPSQPVRLPGAIRENGNTQSILWISH